MSESLEQRSGPVSGNGRRAARHDGGSAERVEALRAEIAHTRADLGQTVQALAAKADVKARARESAQELSGRGRELAVRLADAVRRRPAPIAAAIGAAVLILALVRWRRNR